MDKLCGIAVNRLKISVMDFYEMTPREFDEAIKDNSSDQLILYRTQYEVARYQLLHMWNMQGRFIKHTFRKVTDIDKFSWDPANTEKTQQ